jgi:hypothetical protein
LQTCLVQAQGVVQNTAAIAAGALIGGVLLWDILLRGQQGFSFSFLEEMWSRNIPNLLMSPLRPAEFVGALMVMSLIRLAVGVVPVTLMAISFFGFNLWALAATSKSSAHDAQAHNLRLDRVYCRVLDYGLESRAGRAVFSQRKPSHSEKAGLTLYFASISW